MRSSSYRNLTVLSLSAVVLLALPAAYLYTADRAPAPQDPLAVVTAYLRATYARDYSEAYGYLSSTDQQVKSLDRYLRERGAFNGFALDAARKLATYIEITPVKQEVSGRRAKITVKAHLPDANHVSSLLLSWDPYQLNSLPAGKRNDLLAALDEMKRAGTLKMIAGEETVDLVQENGAWKVFLDWAAGIRITFRVAVPSGAKIDATLPQDQVITRTGELFNLALKVRNRSNQEMFARIGHVVEPREVADYLDLVECGFLLPVRLEGSKEEEFSSTYLVRGSIPERVRRLVVTYDFKLDQN
jgi:hypothetical protein